METAFLVRNESGELGTFGELKFNGVKLCDTCEDPWEDNRKGESCIPAGSYVCRPHTGTKYQNVWEVTNVPNRSAILIHAGNTIDDTQGCILVGKRGVLDGMPAVLNSRTTVMKLRGILPKNFILNITNDY